MLTFKELREAAPSAAKSVVKKKMGKFPVEIKQGPKGFELYFDGDLVADNFKTKKHAEDTAKEVAADMQGR